MRVVFCHVSFWFLAESAVEFALVVVGLSWCKDVDVISFFPRDPTAFPNH